MAVSVIGLNHHSAPVHVREQLSLPEEEALRLLQDLRQEGVFQEAMVLDTCNRTETYYVAGELDDPVGLLLDRIGRVKDAWAQCDRSLFYHHQGPQAVLHLFRVVASLDSQIVGENEIQGQVKRAYSLALQARSAKFLLNQLMHRAFRVGKRVRTETDLGRGCASVSAAAVELARHIFSSLQGKSVLLVGAGETAQLAARALIRCGAGHLTVANRTLSRAEQLARELLSDPGPKEAEQERAATAPPSVRAVELGDIPSVVADADLVISSTGAPGFVLTHQALAERLGRLDHPLLIVDVAVPRDVDPRLGELSNVFLYNIDDLNRLVEGNIQRRRLEIPRAEAIVQWEAQQFTDWLESLQVVPTIKLLKRRFELLQEAQIKRYGHKIASLETAELEEFAGGLCQKILHGPIAYLRESSRNGASSDALAAVDLVRRIFDLDSLEQSE